MAEPVTKCRHGTLDARITRVFQHLSALADNFVQEAVRMVPGVPSAIQRRRQGAIRLPDMPVGCITKRTHRARDHDSTIKRA